MNNVMHIRVCEQTAGNDIGKWRAFLEHVDGSVSALWEVGDTYEEAIANFKTAYGSLPFEFKFEEKSQK
jgi:predicted RNase H-like HicB family nuclease